MAKPPVSAECPACGTGLSAEHESRGLCPRCLVELAIEVPHSAGDPRDDNETEPTSPIRPNRAHRDSS